MDRAGATSGGLKFRSQALDARGRVEALPSAMRVTSGWTTAVVIGLAVKMIGAVIASALVVVPIHVSGGGVIVDRSGVLLSSVVSSSSGYVDTLLVKAGERVEKGQPIARLSLPEQSVAIAKLQKVVDGLQGNAVALDRLAAEDRRDEDAVTLQKAGNFDRQLASMERRLAWLKQEEAAQESLLREGFSTQARAVAARVAVQNAAFQIDQLRTERAQLEQAVLEAQSRRERERRERSLRLEQARLELAAAQANLATENVLRAQVSGRVADLLVGAGAPLTTGQPVINIAADESNRSDLLEAIVYVPLSAGKQISLGDAVLLAPASLREGEHDRLRGRVSKVSGTAATKSAILKALGSEQLYDLVSRQGPVFEVSITLDRDPATPSEFAWTSGHGPGQRLSRGTPVTGKIAVEHVRLLALALPALRRLMTREASVWTGERT